MSNMIQDQAARVTPPCPASGLTDDDVVFVIDTSTTAAYVDLSACPAVFNKYCSIRADGAKIYYAAKSDTAAIDKTASGSTLATAAGLDKCWPCADGEEQPIYLDKRLHRYLHFQAASGTPKLYLRTSSQK